jgi:hypothetical protein
MSRGDPGKRELAQRQLQDAQKLQLSRAFDYVMASPHGRLFVRWLLLVSQWDADPFTGNSQTFHTLGRQAVGREVRDTMMLEHRQEWRQLEDEAQRDAEVALSIRKIPD